MANRFEQFGKDDTAVAPVTPAAPAKNRFAEMDGVNIDQPPAQAMPRSEAPKSEGLYGMSPEGEVAAGIGSSIVAEPIAGLSAILELAADDPSLAGAIKRIDEAREALTYQPRTPDARETMSDVGDALMPVAEGMQWTEETLGNAALEATGSPELAAVAHTLPTAVLEALGVFNYVPRSVSSKYARTVDSGARKVEEGAFAVDQPAPYMKPIPEKMVPEVGGSQASFDQQQANQRLFDEQGVKPAGRSRITGDVKSQQEEGWLLRQTDSREADRYRDRVFIENENVKTRFESIAASLGLPEEAGIKIKDALDGLRSNMASERRAAYRSLSELVTDQSGTVDLFPVRKDGILDASRDVTNMGLDAGKENALAKLLKRYGFAPDDVDVKMSAMDEILGSDPVTPLNIGNLEDMRKEVNRLFPADSADATVRAARGRLISSIDEAFDDLAELADDASLPAQVRDQAKKARELRRKEAITFEAKDLVEQLIKTKPGTGTALVDATEVLPKIRATKKLTEFDKLMKQLENADDLAAVGNLQAATVIDLLNDSLLSGSVIGATRAPAFSGTRLTKALDKFGRLKLKRMFKTRPEIHRALMRLEKLNKLRVTGIEAVQKGSIPPHLVNQAYSMLTQVPVVGRGVKKVAGTVEQRALKQAGKRAEDTTPKRVDIDQFVRLNAPRLAAALALSTAPQVSEQIGNEYSEGAQQNQGGR